MELQKCQWKYWRVFDCPLLTAFLTAIKGVCLNVMSLNMATCIDKNTIAKRNRFTLSKKFVFINQIPADTTLFKYL